MKFILQKKEKYVVVIRIRITYIALLDLLEVFGESFVFGQSPNVMATNIKRRRNTTGSGLHLLKEMGVGKDVM